MEPERNPGGSRLKHNQTKTQRDSAGYTIAMRWQRRLKSNFLKTKRSFSQPPGEVQSTRSQ
jgi:hypothetical protein